VPIFLETPEVCRKGGGKRVWEEREKSGEAQDGFIHHLRRRGDVVDSKRRRVQSRGFSPASVENLR